MQITMLNGEKTPKFESDFLTTVALFYPDSKTTKYTMGVVDVPEIIEKDMNKRFLGKYGRNSDTTFNFYYLYFKNNQWLLVNYNAINELKVECEVELSEREIDKLECIIRQIAKISKTPATSTEA